MAMVHDFYCFSKLNMSMGSFMDKETYDTDEDGKVNSAEWADSAGDADTVDGKHAEDLANVDLSNVEDAQVLEKVKAVDGDGSGLDADLVRGLPADFTCSLSETGYTKLPNGLIVQWGRAQGTQSGTTVNFPIEFPNSCFVVLAVGQGGNTSDSTHVAVDNITTSSFVLRNEGGWGCHWMAIGN